MYTNYVQISTNNKSTCCCHPPLSGTPSDLLTSITTNIITGTSNQRQNTTAPAESTTDYNP
ncbi:unnamed protein product [Ceratitis capitata]|uniref:(Mediterranean fruit fly) hypothetical protein n=1 Tax=Ceratitis capitata TaxID=7213 RepID=A0A811UHR8_CERCA|nr:unnamed protein product [Ceratitis capitata]